MSVKNEWTVGKRYLHGKNGRPLTLRYVGLLPPKTKIEYGDTREEGEEKQGQQWLGVEYDDGLGKHGGVFEGVQVFTTRLPTSGAFIKATKGALKDGKTFVEALEDRYGLINPINPVYSYDPDEDGKEMGNTITTVSLGTSGIEVEAPGIEGVAKRMGRLERLREVGLDNQWIRELGGDRETRNLMKKRLKNVHTLNLSGNLLNGWKDVAEIVDHLEGLRILILNNSRIANLPPDISEQILDEFRRSFEGVQELHLGNAGLDPSSFFTLSKLFRNFKTLYVNDNPLLTHCTPLQSDWKSLATLSLGGCPMNSWDDIVGIIKYLPNLLTLDISRIPLDLIPKPGLNTLSSTSPLGSLNSLIFLSANISKWSDIDALEEWTQGRVKTLRFNLARSEEDEGVDDGLTMDIAASSYGDKISGRTRSDRQMLIASLSGLTVLNSSPIPPAERRDAEAAYVAYIHQLGDVVDHSCWGRYRVLSATHTESVPTASAPVRSTALKSKMLRLKVCMLDTPEPFEPFEMAVLPSSPVSLLRKKISKKLGLSDCSLYTGTVNATGGYEGVSQMEDGQQVGWWLSNGDVVVVIKKRQ